MQGKEAKARIKINKLLEESGWCFFDDAADKVNIHLENNIKPKKTNLNKFSKDFEKIKIKYIVFLLLYYIGFQFIILTSKQKNLNSLFLYEISIFPIEEQQHIISRIENEQKLIDANKELIKLYEQKINTEIDKVWQK
jgi:restriction endonuclease S subunit